MAAKKKSSPGGQARPPQQAGRPGRGRNRRRVKKPAGSSQSSTFHREEIYSGRDLVVPTPRDQVIGASGTQLNCFQVVPANPVYWSGTRVSGIAQQYQLYVPLKFKVHYHPQVAATNPGLVVYGTLYQETSAVEGELQQVLATSNGGGIRQCFHRFTSHVDTRELQMRAFNVTGPPSDTSNIPFEWVATYSGYADGAITASRIPGWVEVEYTYKFMSGNAGTSNGGIGMFVADQQQLATMNRRRALRQARNINWSAPFGVPIGILKDAAIPLLKHVGVVLLNGARTDSVRYGIGKIVTWVADNLKTSRANSDTSLVRDEDGTAVAIPDDTAVVVLMSGMPQQATAPVPSVGVAELSTLILSRQADFSDGTNLAIHEDKDVVGDYEVLWSSTKLYISNDQGSILYVGFATDRTIITKMSMNPNTSLNLYYSDTAMAWPEYLWPTNAAAETQDEEEDPEEEEEDVIVIPKSRRLREKMLAKIREIEEDGSASEADDQGPKRLRK